MARDVLEVAWKEIRKRRFHTAIKLLEDRSEIYEDSADYNILLGTACLYNDEYGAAYKYYNRARKITVTDTNLLLGQAAIYLRRGDTEHAVSYYLDVLENDPENQVAKDALDFIKDNGDYETICRWVDTGKIQQFYPPIGNNPDKIFYILIAVAAFVIGGVLTFAILPKKTDVYASSRMDLSKSGLVLSSEEKSNAQDSNSGNKSHKYSLSESEITNAYEKAITYFNSHDDNHAQVEINRILNSNATSSIKEKARLLKTYLSTPTFDSLKFNPTYKEVMVDWNLYVDCYVSWGGRIAELESANSFYTHNFLVGYEDMKSMDGVVPLKFETAKPIDNEKPLQVLARISSENGTMILKVIDDYQSVKY